MHRESESLFSRVTFYGRCLCVFEGFALHTYSFVCKVIFNSDVNHINLVIYLGHLRPDGHWQNADWSWGRGLGQNAWQTDNETDTTDQCRVLLGRYPGARKGLFSTPTPHGEAGGPQSGAVWQ